MNKARRELNLNGDGTFHPGAPMQRVSQRPGSIPASLSDLQNPDTFDRLRVVLNVDAYVHDLRRIALTVIESELEP